MALVMCSLATVALGSTDTQPGRIPPTAIAVVRRFASADADAQALAADQAQRAAATNYMRLLKRDPEALRITPSGARTALRIISKNQEAARYTRHVSGFVWDSADTSVSDLRVLTRTSTILRLSATVTDRYHIHNTPTTPQPQHYSGASDPYEFTFTRQPTRPWHLAQIRHLGPSV